MKADIPENEEQRIKTLYEYNVLDTPYEHIFNVITEIASSICHTPIAAISLIDQDRQWFKAIKGLDVTATSREVAFCAHTILDDRVMVINDATSDPKFSENPLVVGNPNIRFYAGAPLRAPNGLNVGSLCVIDRCEKELTAENIKNLERLSEIVVELFESRKVTNENNARIAKYIADISNMNAKLKYKLFQERELADNFQIFYQMMNIINTSKTLEEVVVAAKKYQDMMFPSSCELPVGDKSPLKIFHEITDRERQVLRYLVIGFTPKKIGQKLSISGKTVARHLENVSKKLGCYNKSEIIILVFKSGYFMELLSGNDSDILA